jgi:hypothetical protein
LTNKYTYSSIEACFYNRRFPVEIMHGDSIYENQIETFSGAQKQRIDSRNVVLDAYFELRNSTPTGTWMKTAK